MKIIKYHINNKEYITLDDIANDSELNISKRVLEIHRHKLSKKISNGMNSYGIVRNSSECKRKPYGKDSYTQELKDITDIYENMILASFRNQLSKLYKTPKDKYHFATILYNSKLKDYKLAISNKKYEDDTFEIINDARLDGYEQFGTYVIWHNLLTVNPTINKSLHTALFIVTLRTHGFDYVTFKTLYTITQELQDDEEFLDVITRAIKFMESKED